MPVPPSPRSCRRALRRARDGVGLDVDEVTVLLGATGDELAELCAAARVVRDAHLSAEGRPDTLTYSRNVFIPLTRLCRDRCHYCVFATTPHRLPSAFLERDEVLRIARDGAALGCKEALFTLGDTPEDRWPSAREWLAARGYESTVDYLRSCAVAVLEETGLLPHLNPGVLSWSALQRLRPVAASMGMMLETTSTRLGERGGPHHGSPDKDPAVRLRVLADAGRVGVPFTTGLLVGIGETHAERADSLLTLRGVARRYGHLQEIIIQNFRAKPDTAMRDAPDAGREEFLATVAVARLLSPPLVSVQAPPNLAGDSGADLAELLAAGVDDWGGVSPLTPDHVNPERPWPEVELLRGHTETAGFRLVERLAVYPRYVRGGDAWIDPRLTAHVAALAGPDGLARPGAMPVGRLWQEPDGGAGGRVDLHAEIDSVGRHADRRGDFDEVYGDWELVRADTDKTGPNRRVTRLTGAVKAALGLAESGRLLTDTDAVLALLTADGPELAETTALADRLRRETVGDDITYVVNRNINFSNICYVGCRFCAFAQRERDVDSYRLTVRQVASRAVEAAEQGATEVCLQGGIDPKMPVTGYPDLLRAIRAAVPRLHIHAFSPMEIATAAAKAGVGVRDWLIELRAAGLDSVPGTAAEILDDEVRWVLTKGKLPTATWVEVITTAHELGIPSSSTMMYGHVDHPGHWVTHLRVLADIQRATGGFTEFVPLPFVHRNAPIYLAGVARPGPTPRDNQAVIAVSRLALHGLIDNIQCSWVKLGDAATVRALRGGANDLGGTLMEETISRMAGSEHGSARSVADLRVIADRAGRPARQRTTTYA